MQPSSFSDIRIEFIHKYANEYIINKTAQTIVPLYYKYQMLGINPFLHTPPLQTQRSLVQVIWQNILKSIQPQQNALFKKR